MYKLLVHYRSKTISSLFLSWQNYHTNLQSWILFFSSKRKIFSSQRPRVSEFYTKNIYIYAESFSQYIIYVQRPLAILIIYLYIVISLHNIYYIYIQCYLLAQYIIYIYIYICLNSICMYFTYIFACLYVYILPHAYMYIYFRMHSCIYYPYIPHAYIYYIQTLIQLFSVFVTILKTS